MATTHEIAGYLGTDDSVNTCDCCGKTGLKNTVALLTTDGNEVFYGVTCAARALGIDSKSVKSSARIAQREREDKAEAAAQVERDKKQARWWAFVVANFPVTRDSRGEIDWYRTYEQNGGYTKLARAHRESMA